MLINLQLFGETGVEDSAAAEQEVTTEDLTEGTEESTETGVEQEPAAGESVEKAFAARLAKERERLDAEYKQRFEAELKSNPHLSYLEQKAQRLGMTVEQLLENDRKFEEQQRVNELIQQNIPPEYAKEMLENRKFRETYQTQQQQIQQQQAQQKMYADFLQEYPEIKPEQIPAEVWGAVKNGDSLVNAYARHENKLLKQQMQEAQKQQQTEEANAKNAESSTGSVKTHGKTGGFISREQFDANKSNSSWVMKNLDQIEDSRKHWK